MKRNRMNRKNYISIILAGVMLALTGCSDPMPELSEQDSALVAEYAAGVLMKYNKNYSGKIVNDDIIETQLRAEKEFAENTEKYRIEQAAIEEANAQQSAEEGGTATTARSDMSIDQLAGFLGIEPVVLSYEGYTVCDAWPEESSPEDIVFALTATPGQKLCVLKFRLTNPTGESAFVDIYDSRYRFSVIINGDITKQVQATYALEDLAIYKDAVEAGESKEAILVLELKEEEAVDIQTLTVSVSGSEGRARTVLQ